MKTQHATNVRQNFQDAIDAVHYTQEPLLIYKRNKPWVIIQPLSESDKDLQKIVNKKTK